MSIYPDSGVFKIISGTEITLNYSAIIHFLNGYHPILQYKKNITNILLKKSCN